ncbi:hypothetical protein [Aquabacterium olei]|nr:hypothetical protein [Aquabacterium olei]
MSSWMGRAAQRAHEWAADRFSFVQYPRIRPVTPAAAPMTPGQYLVRLLAGLVGVVLTLAGAMLVLGGVVTIGIVLMGVFG